MSELASRLDEARTVRSWLHLTLDRYVVGQHLLTGARKWADGRDGFLFHPSDTGYQLSPGERLTTTTPSPGPTKIPAALSLLRGIQLVEVDLVDGKEQWAVTALGRSAVKRVLGDPGP